MLIPVASGVARRWVRLPAKDQVFRREINARAVRSTEFSLLGFTRPETCVFNDAYLSLSLSLSSAAFVGEWGQKNMIGCCILFLCSLFMSGAQFFTMRFVAIYWWKVIVALLAIRA
jgi:hypothetical protein